MFSAFPRAFPVAFTFARIYAHLPLRRSFYAHFTRTRTRAFCCLCPARLYAPFTHLHTFYLPSAVLPTPPCLPVLPTHLYTRLPLPAPLPAFTFYAPFTPSYLPQLPSSPSSAPGCSFRFPFGYPTPASFPPHTVCAPLRALGSHPHAHALYFCDAHALLHTRDTRVSARGARAPRVLPHTPLQRSPRHLPTLCLPRAFCARAAFAFTHTLPPLPAHRAPHALTTRRLLYRYRTLPACPFCRAAAHALFRARVLRARFAAFTHRTRARAAAFARLRALCVCLCPRCLYPPLCRYLPPTCLTLPAVLCRLCLPAAFARFAPAMPRFTTARLPLPHLCRALPRVPVPCPAGRCFIFTRAHFTAHFYTLPHRCICCPTRGFCLYCCAHTFLHFARALCCARHFTTHAAHALPTGLPL